MVTEMGYQAERKSIFRTYFIEALAQGAKKFQYKVIITTYNMWINGWQQFQQQKFSIQKNEMLSWWHGAEKTHKRCNN